MSSAFKAKHIAAGQKWKARKRDKMWLFPFRSASFMTDDV